ncbi:hypothetical protein D3C78_1867590 [compost metagenome]
MQTSTIVVALPLIPALGVLAWSLVRMIRTDFGDQLEQREVVLAASQVTVSEHREEMGNPDILRPVVATMGK